MVIAEAAPFDSVPATQAALAAQGYIADDALALTLFLAFKLGRPLLLEGAPGVGKTELAKAATRILDTDLIRLQCYEGLDLAQAAYEWNYPRQLLEIQSRGAASAARGIRDLFTEEYLLRRPLLKAIDPRRTSPPVLLIDELDRADEEFESFLLEVLSDFQITIPELGTLRAVHRPLVLLTSNRTRDVHDALKRRCLYHWIDYPTAAKEAEILRRRVPGLEPRLSRQIARFVERLRQAELYKAPGVAESIDWAQALTVLGLHSLSAPEAQGLSAPEAQGPESAEVLATLGCLLKHQDDVERVQGGLGQEILAAVASA